MNFNGFIYISGIICFVVTFGDSSSADIYVKHIAQQAPLK